MSEKPQAVNDIDWVRLGAIQSHEKEDGRPLEDFGPGSFGMHECIERASITMEILGDLMEKPSIIADLELYTKANDAFAAAYNLYQAIGAIHLNEPTNPKKVK